MTGTELAEVIQVVADKLEIASTELVGIFSKAQVGIGTMHLIQILVFTCIMYLAIKETIKHFESQTEGDNKWYEGSRGEDRLFHFFTIIFAIGVFTIFALLIVGNALLHIIYPDYYGIKDLIISFSSVT